MTTVLVTGGRYYYDWIRLRTELDRIEGVAKLMHGACKTGADVLADRWAVMRKVKVERYPADWIRHGHCAGPIRNRTMVKQRPDLCVAFPGGRGTADCVAKARAAGIPVIEVR